MVSEKTIEQKYQKKTQKEHILDRPDSYIGDIKLQNDFLWTYNPSTNKMVKKSIEYVPGLIKIFDEILVNAGDNTKEDDLCDCIKVEINKEENLISVLNNGKGIDIVEHKDHKILVPELIFGELLTSTNYDDNEKRITGGRNGYGAKLANIYSLEFEVEIVDKERCKRFKQTFSNNMSDKTKPKISTLKNVKSGYTKISFKPDLKRFGLNELTDDVINLMIKRVYDIAATTDNKVKLYYNNEKINVNNFKNYISLFFDTSDLIYEDINDRWQVGVLYLPENGYDQISYVNCISTFKGGNHVKMVENDIIKKVEDQILKKNKNIKIKPQNIKENLVFFINSVIINPSFTSQTKEELKTKQNDFGSKCELSESFVKKVLKTGIADQVLLYAKLKEESLIKKKTDGKKVGNLKGIPKLEDANWAGTKKSSECKLILTEGDSAKAFAMAGRSVVGNDKYGIFPLKGKLLNVRDASPKQLLENEELKNIKLILGLQQGKNYTSINELRYGGIILLTDQDTDGFHIKGLLINFLHYFWPSIVKLNLFIYSLATPIVKATKGKTIKTFYNISKYEKWKSINDTKSYNIKYYKGLGTSDSKEAKEYFSDLEDKLVKYTWENVQPNINEKIDSESDDETTETIKLAFEKKRSDDRKKWLLSYNKDEVLDNNDKSVPIPNFIHKELKHFSNDDLNRSIPSISDGLKISTRKILYSTFLRKLFTKKDELRVAQLAGYVSDKTCYHHGEASLCDAIVGMAQNYVGSNNINLLYPAGQFGSRVLSGKDKASPRYIHTYLEKLTKYIFRSEDEPILNYLNDDGVMIEPEQYFPIIPMVLVNGAEGIGTGFSTSIPNYNPKDIIQNIFNLMDSKDVKTMKPWYKNFKGCVSKMDDFTYEVIGDYTIIDDNRIIINELPIGTWTTMYKEYLESIQYDNDSKKNTIIGFTDNNTDERVHFVVTFPDRKLNLYQSNNTLYDRLRLIKKLKTSNMNLFNEEGRIMNFKKVEDILKYWYDIRLKKYEERKIYLIGKIENELDLLKYKSMFIEYVIDKKIIIFRKKKNEIIEKLEKLKFPRLSNVGDDKSYDYITSIPLFNLTEEKIEELKNKLKEKEKELEYVKITTPIQMWKIELKELLKEYTTWQDSKEKEFNNNISGDINISKLNKKTDIKKKNKVKKL